MKSRGLKGKRDRYLPALWAALDGAGLQGGIDIEKGGFMVVWISPDGDKHNPLARSYAFFEGERDLDGAFAEALRTLVEAGLKA